MKKVIIIPARYGSSRYKGKPLVKILNREMVLRVADICSKVVNKKELFCSRDCICSNVPGKIWFRGKENCHTYRHRRGNYSSV